MQAPIFQFNQQRDDIVDEVVRRVLSETRDPIFALNDAAYHEIRRLEGGGRPEDLAEWRKLARTLSGLDPYRARELLREVAMRHARDINGNFNPRVYRFASRVVPPGLSVLLSPQAVAHRPLTEIARGEALADLLTTSGPIEQIRKLTSLGTVVFVPTHLSHLDSPVFAYAIFALGLPPVSYGAGKNLFTNVLLSFFMRNLGAYRVDRRLKHELYKHVLKAYSSILIERGFHSLFFPGGTRSRSGGVEQKLKLGLAGTGLEAFVRTSMACRPRKVFFVPATINYMLTLEAETLIDDHLKEQGKARYIIEDDESTRLDRIAVLVRKLAQMEGSCAVRFGAPVDPFGNRVDDEGISHDNRGRRVDPASYIRNVEHGGFVLDAGRDAQYTRELADVIVASYQRDTVALTTHVVATAAFDRLRARMPHADLFALLRRQDEVVVPHEELHQQVSVVQQKLAALEASDRIVVSPSVRNSSPSELVRDAERALNGYHTSRVLDVRHEGVALLDPRLLLYYQNRLAAHGVAWSGGLSAAANREPRTRSREEGA